MCVCVVFESVYEYGIRAWIGVDGVQMYGCVCMRVRVFVCMYAPYCAEKRGHIHSALPGLKVKLGLASLADYTKQGKEVRSRLEIT